MNAWTEEESMTNPDLEQATRRLEEALASLRRLDGAPAQALDGTCDLAHELVTELDRLCDNTDGAARRPWQHEREVLEAIVEHTDTHLAYLDREFRFVRVNATYAHGSGYSVEELIGADHFGLFPHAENEAIFRQVRDTGQAVAFQAKPFAYPDRPELGVTYWDWTLTPVKDVRGRVEGLVFSLIDVTERQRAEDEVRQLARFPGENPNPVLRVLADGTISYANAASAPLLEAWQRAAGGRVPELWQRRMEEALRQGEAQEGEVEVGERSFALTLAPVPEQGYVNVYGLDVTARREAQRARRRHADRLWLLHQASHAILTAHSEKEMAQAVLRQVPHAIRCVRACVVTFDLEAGRMSMLGAYVGGEMQPEEDWQAPLDAAWGEVVEKLAQGRTHVVADVQALCPAEPRLEQLQAEGVRAHICAPLLVEGQLIGSLNLGLPTAGPIDHEQMSFIHGLADELAIGIRQMRLYRAVQDHAEALEQEVRRRTAQLVSSEARFRAVFERAALGIALLDEEGRIVASNPALETMLGYSAEALRGTSLAAFVDPAQAPANGSLYRELVDGRRASYAEQRRYLRPDGSAIYANVTLSLVPGIGESEFGESEFGEAELGQSGFSESEFGHTDRFAIALVEDVTERREAQAALIESEKLALIGQLAASLAHEVNNPLQAVVGCLGLAQEVLEEEGNVGRYIEIALEELERAVRVMRRMQDLSRRSDHEEREAADVGDLLEKVLLLTEKRCRDAGIEVALCVGEDLPSPPVIGDQIQQVLLNLVLNAVDAMPDGGTLAVRAARVERPAGVEISVSDTGSGIPAGFMARLYRPFETTKVAGLGLGLYVCRTIIEQHEGQIVVDSEPGKGTTFTVWLPAG
jgi:PAS domain S-box-containing protein